MLRLLPKYQVLELPGEAGMLCGRTLALFGAEVIKIEPPEGDPVRHRAPFYHDIPCGDKSLYWCYFNVAKKGITLNLESPEGMQLFKELVRHTDVVIDGFRANYMNELGIGYSELSKINPTLVMCSITAFGQDGPYTKLKVTDIVGVALGGLVRILGTPDQPYRLSFPTFYSLGSIHAAAAIVLALYNRTFTSKGQYIDTSCQEAVAWSIMIAPYLWLRYKTVWEGRGIYGMAPRQGLPPLRMRHIWECKDGYVVLLWGGGTQPGLRRSTEQLAEWAAQEGVTLELKNYDWRSWDSSKIPQEEVDRLEHMISSFLKTKTKKQLMLGALKRKILLVPVNTIKDLAESEQAKRRGFFEEVDHQDWGEKILYPGLPIKVSEHMYGQTERAPFIGEHNVEIYHERLGIPKRELEFLKAGGVI